MQNDALRQRLEALNRGPLPKARQMGATGSAGAKPTWSALAEPLVPRNKKLGTAAFCPAGMLQRGEVIETSVGEHWRIRQPLEMLWNGGAKLVEARQEHLQSLLSAARQAIEPNIVFNVEFAAFVSALPDRAVVLDLETCGLAGAALFLVGLLRQIDGSATIELLLARNYAEEAAVLETLWQAVAGCEVLLTFNGKTFDWPMVLERSVRHRSAAVRTGPSLHLDILHHARRRWRKQLPNCRLKTLETHVCRRTRPADIPGQAIPGVYANYVRTGFERDMEIVLYHNAIDLVTLFDLALRLAA